jgi:hypothetical protein
VDSIDALAHKLDLPLRRIGLAEKIVGQEIGDVRVFDGAGRRVAAPTPGWTHF